MKKFFTLLVAVLLTAIAFSQVPEKMSYQAVIRDADNALVKSIPVGMKISILQGSPTGTPVYTETLTPTTNVNGLISIEIGGGAGFSSINWSAGSYFLKTETDPAGGTNYSITGTSQLLSVPYALYSKNAESAADAVKLTGDQTIESIKTFSNTIKANNGIDANNKAIANVASPVAIRDAATKAYVDLLIQKIDKLETLLGVEDPVTDIDGNIYQTVKIGRQIWFSENLKTSKYTDGTDVPLITDASAWSSLTTPGYCWYDNDVAFKDIYGALYNWYAISETANGNKKICPAGWHVSTYADWGVLIEFLGGASIAGGLLKEIGTAYWTSPNSGGTNATHFTALPGGYRHYNGSLFESEGLLGFWWSSTEENASTAWRLFMNYNSNDIASSALDKNCGFSVRCVKN